MTTSRVYKRPLTASIVPETFEDDLLHTKPSKYILILVSWPCSRSLVAIYQNTTCPSTNMDFALLCYSTPLPPSHFEYWPRTAPFHGIAHLSSSKIESYAATPWPKYAMESRQSMHRSCNFWLSGQGLWGKLQGLRELLMASDFQRYGKGEEHF